MIGAQVYLWGTRIGFVAFDDTTGLGSFEYDTAFLASGIEVSPIMMPLSGRVFVFPELPRKSFYGLPGLLSEIWKCRHRCLAPKTGPQSGIIQSGRTTLLHWQSWNGRFGIRSCIRTKSQRI